MSAAANGIEVAVETAAADWTRFVEAQADATAYHEWAWRDVFTRAFGHEPLYLAARRGGRIAGVLPMVLLDSRLFGRALFSLPFLNYGGVLAEDDQTARALVDAASAVAADRKCKHVELRHTRRRFDALPCKQHKVSMLLPLVEPEKLWNGLDRKVRNQVRKAEKSELTCVSGNPGDAALLDEFYSVFARNMRDLGTPVYGRNFFAEMLRTFPDRATIHIVRKAALPIAGGFTLRTRGTTEIPWASSVRDFNALCPNHLLYWTMIKSAAAGGCTTFDFGRSTPGEGTFKFKEQWGAQPLELCWEYVMVNGGAMPDTSPKNPKFKLAISLWSRLPLPVANALGPAIVRSIP